MTLSEQELANRRCDECGSNQTRIILQPSTGRPIHQWSFDRHGNLLCHRCMCRYKGRGYKRESEWKIILTKRQQEKESSICCSCGACPAGVRVKTDKTKWYCRKCATLIGQLKRRYSFKFMLVKILVDNDISKFRCVGCGESDPIVLQIDHINGGGTQDRKRFKGSYDNMLRYYLTNYTPDQLRKMFQLMCGNCNWRKYYKNLKSSKDLLAYHEELVVSSLSNNNT